MRMGAPIWSAVHHVSVRTGLWLWQAVNAVGAAGKNLSKEPPPMAGNEWWKGKALDQGVHEAINARHYPGTRQLCFLCNEPTGRCEEDAIYTEDGERGPFCEDCWKKEPLHAK